MEDVCGLDYSFWWSLGRHGFSYMEGLSGGLVGAVTRSGGLRGARSCWTVWSAGSGFHGDGRSCAEVLWRELWKDGEREEDGG